MELFADLSPDFNEVLVSFQPIFDDCPMSSTFISEEDKLAAESLIDQLFCGSIAIDLEDQEFNDLVEDTSDATVAAIEDIDAGGDADHDSGFVDACQMSSSEMVMPDGTKVIIVIAPESPESSQISVASPVSPDFVASSPESDESWSPEPTNSSGLGRKRATERKGGVRKAKSTIVDKKERKKHQNVEAARRYR